MITPQNPDYQHVIDDEDVNLSSRSGHTKDYHKIGTNYLPAWHACVN